MMSEVYFSIDIETNGLTAGINSMISLGAAAINMETGTISSTFKVNIVPVLDLAVDKPTMKWWKQFPESYKRATSMPIPASIAIKRFLMWFSIWRSTNSVIAAWKPGFDLAFLRYYIERFAKPGDKQWFTDHARPSVGLDIKTLAAAALNNWYSSVQITTIPDMLLLDSNGEVFVPNPAHDALQDAIKQAYIMYNASRKLGVEI